MNYVEQFTPFEQVKRDAEELRERCGGRGKERTQYGHGKFWLTFSAYKDEKPVNLVIPRKTLEGLQSSAHYVCRRNENPERMYI